MLERATARAIVRGALALLSIATATGCAAVDGARAAHCDDTVTLASSVPPGLTAVGISRVVGSGDTWLVAPAVGEWSSSVQTDGRGSHWLKVAVWTSAPQLPRVEVRQLDGPNVGTVSFAPTTAGLGAPVPMGASFPSQGCWSITAQGPAGEATARVRIPPLAPR